MHISLPFSFALVPISISLFGAHKELSSVVGGIRLYNKFSKKGGALIPDCKS